MYARARVCVCVCVELHLLYVQLVFVHFADNHSRVTLSVTDENGSDYINASYIDVGWACSACTVKLLQCLA